MNVTPLDDKLDGTLFGGVTDWYPEPRRVWGHQLDELSCLALSLLLFPYITLVITPPTTQIDTTVIPTEIPIIAPTIPPSQDYTPTSPDYSQASDTDDTLDTPPSPTHDHSSPDLPSTSARPSRKRRRSPMTSLPALSLVFGALSLVRADLIPSPKRVRDSGYLADVEVDPRETSLRVDVSDDPHIEQDIHLEIQPEINECIAYTDALRDRGIDARVVVEAVDQEESKTGMRGPVEVRVDRVTHPMMPEDTPEPAQEERVVEYQREHGRRTVGVESTVTALTERIAKLERDNRRLRGTASVEGQRVDRLQRGMKMPNTRSGASMAHEEIEDLVARQVNKEIKARKVGMNLEPLNENRDEQEGGNGENGNEENGNGGRRKNGNRNRNHGMNYGGFIPVDRECTFQDILKCKPHNFSGTKGVQNVRGQNVARTYTAGNNERKGYVGSLPYCNKCRFHHEGPCTVRYGNCKKVGHLTRNCTAVVAPNTQRVAVGNQLGIVCYECGRLGHFRKDYPKLRNQNRGNQTENKNGNKTGSNEATAKAYAIGGGANLDSNIATDTSYAVELADGRISETNVVLRGCTLGLLGHPCNTPKLGRSGILSPERVTS
nr:hypothetical protein [Tanacetum cinerariifolium]